MTNPAFSQRSDDPSAEMDYDGVVSRLRHTKGSWTDEMIQDAIAAIEALRKGQGHSEPKPTTCPFCDFGSGMRGMDRCAKCDGTGSVFRVGLRTFPNTKEGYDEAVVASQPTGTGEAAGLPEDVREALVQSLDRMKQVERYRESYTTTVPSCRAAIEFVESVLTQPAKRRAAPSPLPDEVRAKLDELRAKVLYAIDHCEPAFIADLANERETWIADNMRHEILAHVRHLLSRPNTIDTFTRKLAEVEGGSKSK